MSPTVSSSSTIVIVPQRGSYNGHTFCFFSHRCDAVVLTYRVGGKPEGTAIAAEPVENFTAVVEIIDYNISVTFDWDVGV